MLPNNSYESWLNTFFHCRSSEQVIDEPPNSEKQYKKDWSLKKAFKIRLARFCVIENIAGNSTLVATSRRKNIGLSINYERKNSSGDAASTSVSERRGASAENMCPFVFELGKVVSLQVIIQDFWLFFTVICNSNSAVFLISSATWM